LTNLSARSLGEAKCLYGWQSENSLVVHTGDGGLDHYSACRPKCNGHPATGSALRPVPSPGQQHWLV
jgi:hypothetical protein